MTSPPQDDMPGASQVAPPPSSAAESELLQQPEALPEQNASFRHRVKGLDRRAEAVRNIVAVMAGLATILGVMHNQGLIEMAWPPFHLPGSKEEPISIAAPIDPPQARLGDVDVTHGVALGTGCMEKQWDCSKFAESDYERLGMLVRFTLDTRNISGSTLEVIWRLLEQNPVPEAEPTEVATGPGWPRGTFPVVSMEESGNGELWIPYPNLDGHFYAELQVTGMPDGSSDSINSSTFELPMPKLTPDEAIPKLQALPTAERTRG